MAGAGGGGAAVQFSGTANILLAREALERDNGVESMAAFHRWRMSSMKTQYGRQLRSILTDVRKDEERLKHAQSAVSEYQSREAALNNEVSKLRVENSRASAELERFLSEYRRLEQALQDAIDNREVAVARAEASEASVRVLEATAGSGGSVDKAKWESLMTDLETMKTSQTKLLDTLASRDEAVASMGSEAQAAKHQLKQARADLERMEGIVRSTGEKAAVAEARAADLEVEIAGLREATRRDYAEKRRLAAASEEIEDYKQQLAETSSVNASLAAARDELKSALNATSQRLAASEGRNDYLSKAADFLLMLERVFEGTGYAQQDDHLRKLGAEVTRMTSEAADMAGQIDQLECIVSQKEEQIDELHSKNKTLKMRNLLLEDAATKNRRLQLALDEAKDFNAEEKSLRVAAEHRAASLASQNSLKDYILKVRAKSANEDIAAALEKLNAELNHRTDDAAALAGRASLAESRLDDVTALQSALAAKISDLETMRAQEGADVVHTASRPAETSTLLGSIHGPGPAVLVPQEALQMAERRRAAAEAKVSQLQRLVEDRQDSIRAFVGRVAGLYQLVDLTAIFSQWRSIVSQTKMSKYLHHSTTRAQVQLALVSIAGRHSERSFQARMAVMFAGWRVRTARVHVVASKWRNLAAWAVADLSDISELHSCGIISFIRLRRLRGGGFFSREVSELQTLRLLLRGWKTHVTQCKLDDLTASLPPWIERIGEKRCMEKHWMAWRIATYASLAGRNKSPAPEPLAGQSAASRPGAQCPSQVISSQPVFSVIDTPGGSASVQTGGAQVAEPQYFPPSPVTPYIPPTQVQEHRQAAVQLAEYRRGIGAVIPDGFTSSILPQATGRSKWTSSDIGVSAESFAPTARPQGALPRPHTSASGPSPGWTGRSVSAPPQRADHPSQSGYASVSPGLVSPLQKPLKKGTGRGGMPNRPLGELDPKPMYAFGHHIPPEDETAASIAAQALSSPLRQHRTSPGPDIEPRVYISSPRVPRQADNTPVVQAFGTTVSHDRLALPIATGQPSMRDLVPPDAVPMLPGSVAGPATKAKAVERVVDALAHTLNEVASSLAHGTARAEYAVDRLHMSPTKAQLRTSLVRHGMTGPLAIGDTSFMQTEYSMASPRAYQRSPPVRPISNMPSVTSRIGAEAVSPKKIKPTSLSPDTSGAETRQVSGSCDAKGLRHDPGERSIGPGSNTFERQHLTNALSIRGSTRISSPVAIQGDEPPQATSTFQAVRQGSPMSSPRNIAGTSAKERGVPNLCLDLLGTGPLSPREKRDFENLLTSGASGYSPRELRELQQRGEELLNQPLQSLSALQAGGSHLVVPQTSRLLQSTAASDTKSHRSSASASQTERLRSKSPGAQSNRKPLEKSRAASPTRAPGTASAQKPFSEPKPSKSASPISCGKVQSRLFNPTAASLSRASAVKRSAARREAEKENETAQRP